MRKKSSIISSCTDYIFIAPDIAKPSPVGYCYPDDRRRLKSLCRQEDGEAFVEPAERSDDSISEDGAGPGAGGIEKNIGCSEDYDFRRANGIPDMPVYIEIGSGKGQFLTRMAQLHPENYYLACEGGANIYIRILQKAQSLGLRNIKVISDYIVAPEEWFPESSLDGIYINFCDPWPKSRHAHRRLTARRLLEQYKTIAKPGAHLMFKTDNDELFEWSLEEFAAAGLLPPVEFSRGLWHSEYAEDNICTEYEDRFGDAGKSINYIKLRLK